MEHRYKFMFLTHGNLWTANWEWNWVREKKMGDEDGTRSERREISAQLLGLIPG